MSHTRALPGRCGDGSGRHAAPRYAAPVIARALPGPCRDLRIVRYNSRSAEWTQRQLPGPAFSFPAFCRALAGTEQRGRIDTPALCTSRDARHLSRASPGLREDGNNMLERRRHIWNGSSALCRNGAETFGCSVAELYRATSHPRPAGASQGSGRNQRLNPPSAALCRKVAETR
jgi:hypothetical protein